MKQRRIQELTINHYEHGASVAYTPSRTEEYAPVLAQAEAHQDLRFHTEINSVETLVILPWESVIGVYATYETAEVAAPTDTICGGGDEPGVDFQFVMENPATVLVQNNEDECFISYIALSSFTVDGVTYESGSDEFNELTLTLTIGGKTYEYSHDNSPTVDCADFTSGTTESATIVGHFRGVDSTPFTFDASIYT